MEIKKSPKADLESKKSTWLLVGYVIVLAFMFVAFEWTRDIRVDTSGRINENVFEQDMEIPLTRQPEVAPPPPPQVTPINDVLTIIDDDANVEETNFASSEETGEDVTRDDSWNYADVLWNGIQAKAVAAAFDQLSYKKQWYLEKRNAICMTCGRVSPLSTQSTFEDLAVDFEGTTASGAERFYRRTLDKLRLKLLESRLVHTVTLKQTECRKRNKK